MSKSLRFILATSCALVTACGGGGGGDGGGDDDGVDIDAGTNPPAEGFRIQSPMITIEPGQEVTYCYYTTINIPRTMGVKRWSSTMTPGSHHLILFFQAHGKTEGSIDQDCGGVGGSVTNLPVWTYSAQTPTNEAVMPSGIGMQVDQGQQAYVQMHYFNATDAPIVANVTIDAEAYTAAETFTPAAAFVTYNTNINIPANSTGMAQGTCNLPPGAKFFTMSTHAHKHATLTRVTDGANMVFESTQWEHPGQRQWAAAPFYSFGSQLTYRCEYNNTSNQVVREGDSAATDEMCMAVGYFFVEGATTLSSRFCVNDFLIP